MKKYYFVALTFILLLAVADCSSESGNEQETIIKDAQHDISNLLPTSHKGTWHGERAGIKFFPYS